MTNPTGEYGGRINRDITTYDETHSLVKKLKGTVLAPEEAITWPLATRMALEQSGKVTWFGPPSSGEAVAREKGAPAPARKTTATTVPAPVVTTPVVSGRPRRGGQ